MGPRALHEKQVQSALLPDQPADPHQRDWEKLSCDVTERKRIQGGVMSIGTKLNAAVLLAEAH